MSELIKATELQTAYLAMSDNHLKMRSSDSPEFKKEFIKTFSDLIFSQNDEMLEKLSKTKPASLLNAVFRATEIGASFAKKEISFIPYEIFKKEKKDGIEKKTATGEFEAVIIVDINFQKQQILKLENCKRFFTAEVHEGVKILSDLSTGSYIFEGENDVTKPTVGYFSVFISDSDERYELYMSCAEIVERAKFSPGFKADNYKKTSSSIHYEKIVVRNLLKIIPRISKELKSILASDESLEFTEYEEVQDKPNRLEEAKKELAGQKVEEKKETPVAGTKKKTPEVAPEVVTPEQANATAPDVGFDNKFF